MERDFMKILFGKNVLLENTTIKDAALYLEHNDFGKERAILYIVDDQNHLLGSLMDADIRRALISTDITNEMSVSHIMKKNPRKIIEGSTLDKKTLKDYSKFQYLPIVDKKNCLIGFKETQKLYSSYNKIIIMAGGLGKRLRPLTEHTPKPMLTLGGKPILQEIIESFKHYGFINFSISVNYKSHIIKEYFGNGENFNVNISYIEEDQQMGTCGSIKLIEASLLSPFFVINGDILANINYEEMLKQHITEENQITICVFPHQVTIPYGVINTDLNQVVSISEKPTYTYPISCGVYIINPEIVKMISKDENLDMPTLIQRALLNQYKIGTFLIEEWIDIGNLEDFYRAQNKINQTKENI